MLTHQALTCVEKISNYEKLIFGYSKESAFNKAAHAMLGNLTLELTAEVQLAPNMEVGTDVGQAVGQERKFVLPLAVDLGHSVTAGHDIIVGIVDAQRTRMATLNLGVVAHNLVLAVANVVVVPGALNLEAVDERAWQFVAEAVPLAIPEAHIDVLECGLRPLTVASEDALCGKQARLVDRCLLLIPVVVAYGRSAMV